MKVRKEREGGPKLEVEADYRIRPQLVNNYEQGVRGRLIKSLDLSCIDIAQEFCPITPTG